MKPKKTPAANLEAKRMLFFQIGLLISLAFVYFIFEWKSGSENNFSLGQMYVEDVPEEIIPITKQQEVLPPPPPPPSQQPMIVQNDVLIENEAQVEENEISEDATVIEMPPAGEQEVDEPEIFIIAEEMPRYPDGEDKMFSYLSTNIRYPGMALESGIGGTVFLSFVVDADGSVKNVKVLKGIGGGCDEEAVRVVQSMPKWIPGRQRNKPVPVQYSIPVKFQLR